MTDLPTTGGSYVRDPETGKLLRAAKLTDQEEPPERNLMLPDPPVADVTPVAETEPPAPAEPAPKRRSTSKGVL